jgi:enhancing lycopene biosynthesis protein 2
MPPALPRVALVLSGCGVHDGSEIHEAVLALLALDRAGASVVFAAPNTSQTVVFNHYTGEPNRFETRNVLVESGRIARGAAVDLAALGARDLDAAVFPGGYGATRNLCDHATRGHDATVHAEVARLIRELHGARKPMAFLCTSPILAARVLGASAHPLLTVGRDSAVAQDLVAWGARHRDADARGVVIDRDNRIVSTPAYMLPSRVSEVADGIDRAVRAVLEMV